MIGSLQGRPIYPVLCAFSEASLEFHQPVSGGARHHSHVQPHHHQQAAEEGTTPSLTPPPRGSCCGSRPSNVRSVAFSQLYVNSRYAKPRFKKFGFEVYDTGNMYLIRTPAGLKLQWFHSTGMMVMESDSSSNKLATRGLCGAGCFR